MCVAQSQRPERRLRRASASRSASRYRQPGDPKSRSRGSHTDCATGPRPWYTHRPGNSTPGHWRSAKGVAGQLRANRLAATPPDGRQGSKAAEGNRGTTSSHHIETTAETGLLEGYRRDSKLRRSTAPVRRHGQGAADGMTEHEVGPDTMEAAIRRTWRAPGEYRAGAVTGARPS